MKPMYFVAGVGQHSWELADERLVVGLDVGGQLLPGHVDPPIDLLLADRFRPPPPALRASVAIPTVVFELRQPIDLLRRELHQRGVPVHQRSQATSHLTQLRRDMPRLGPIRLPKRLRELLVRAQRTVWIV